MTNEYNSTPHPSHHHNSSRSDGLDCEQLRLLIPAYSIGATDAQETAWVESMLEYCPDAAAELTDYLMLGEALLYTSAPVEINRAVPLDVPMPHLPPAAASLPGVAPLVTPPKPTMPGPRVLPRNSRLSQVSTLRAAIAVVALLMLGITNFYWLNETQRLSQTQRVLEASMQQTQIAAVPLDAGQVYHRDLIANTAANVAEDAHATLIWNTAREVGSVYVTGLPPLSSDKIYQLWLVRDADGRAVSLGRFRVDDLGTGTLVFEAPEPIETFQHVGISQEPAEGSPAPTTPHLVIGSI